MRLPILMLIPLFALAAAPPGRPFAVAETGERFAELQQAVNAIGDGEGTIEIAPGVHRGCAVQQAGRIAFRAAKPGTAVFRGGICEDKATLVLRGREALVEGLTFTGTAVKDGNGAGIRLERGDLRVSRSSFHDAQTGILSGNDPASGIWIEGSSFAGLGKHPDEWGVHSIYIGNYGSLSVKSSRFERGASGHYVKSRAARIHVTDSSFDDSRGRNTDYMIDMPNGATGRIAGNSFVNGRNKENYGTMIALGAEGRVNPSAGLVIEQNRAWLVPNFPFRTSFVGSWTDEPIILRNNRLAPGIEPFARR